MNHKSLALTAGLVLALFANPVFADENPSIPRLELKMPELGSSAGHALPSAEPTPQLKLKLRIEGTLDVVTDRNGKSKIVGNAPSLGDVSSVLRINEELAAMNAGGKRPCPGAPTTPVPEPKEGLHRKLWVVSAEYVALQFAGLAILSALPKDATQWGKGGVDVLLKSAAQGPHFDTDHSYFNYVAHPVVGSQTYLLARNRGANWWESLLYSTAMSALWEFGIEGSYERASIQDLIITPAAGAIIGEGLYQAKQALLDRDGRAHGFKKVLVIMLDPIDALSGGLK